MNFAERAAPYAAMGARVHPLMPGSKKPLVDDWPAKASADPAQLAAWGQSWPDANVGVVCGEAVSVIDIDGPEGWEPLRGVLGVGSDLASYALGAVETPRGRHIYVPASLGFRRRIGVLPHLDILGRGGYVVGAGSVLADGGEYVVELPLDLNRQIDTSPWERLREALDRPRDVETPDSQPWDGQPPTADEQAYLDTALESACEAVAGASEGERNHTLNREAYGLYRLAAGTALDAHTVTVRLTEAADAAGLEDEEINATLRSAASTASKKPRSVPERGPRLTPELFAPNSAQEGAEAPSESRPPQAARSSWEAVDFGPYLDGTHQAPEPTQFAREDGVCLFYSGLTHSLHGESESGKSWVALHVCVEQLRAGRHVLYCDYESDAASIVQRLRVLGATDSEISELFHYVQPETAPTREAEAFQALLEAHPYALAVIDGVTESLGIAGRETVSNDDVTRWANELPNRIAKTGAAVVQIDHVTKDAGTRGRFAIGGQAKMASITGAAYVVEVRRPLGRGRIGELTLRVAKDRPGYVRGHAGHYRAADRTQEAARFVLDSTGDSARVFVHAPAAETEGQPETGQRRLTTIMEQLSRMIEDSAEPLTFNELRKRSESREGYVRRALTSLISEGHVSVQTGARNSQLHTSERPYRAADDPHSDEYRGGGDSHRLQSTVTVSQSKDWGDGDSHHRLRGDSGRQSETVPSNPAESLPLAGHARPDAPPPRRAPVGFRGFVDEADR